MFGLSKLDLTLIAIAVLVIAAIVGQHVIYSQGYDAATGALQPKIDVLTGIVTSDELTIKQMQADAQANDQLVSEYADQISALNQQTLDDQTALQRLQANDKSVSAYLSTPVPDALRRLLNDEPAAPAGHQDGPAPAAAGAGPAVPGSSKR